MILIIRINTKLGEIVYSKSLYKDKYTYSSKIVLIAMNEVPSI